MRQRPRLEWPEDAPKRASAGRKPAGGGQIATNALEAPRGPVLARDIAAERLITLVQRSSLAKEFKFTQDEFIHAIKYLARLNRDQAFSISRLTEALKIAHQQLKEANKGHKP